MADKVELVFDITGNAAKSLKETSDQGKKTLGGLENDSKKAGSGVKSLTNNIADLVSVAGGLIALKKSFSFVKEVNENRDSVLNLSNATGIAVQDLSELQYAAELNKTSFTAVEASMKKMVMTLGQAELGSKNSKMAFSGLGIEIRKADGSLKDANSLFEESIQALSEVENETERLSKAQLIFGRGAAELGSIIKGGAEGLREAKNEAQALGVAFDRDAAEASARFNDNLLRVESSAKSVGLAITESITPALAGMLEALGGDGVVDKMRLYNNEAALMDVRNAQLDNDLGEITGIYTQLTFGMDSATRSIQLQNREWELLSEQIEITGKDISTALTGFDAQGSGQKMRGTIGGKSGKSNVDNGSGNAKEVLFGVDWEKLKEDQQKQEEAIDYIYDVRSKAYDKDLALKQEKADAEAQINADRLANELYTNQAIMDQEKAKQQMYMDTTGVLISSALTALSASKKSAKEQQAIALAQVLISGAVASGKVWADLGWPAAIAPQIQIAAQTTAQAAVIGSQSFQFGGEIQPEPGLSRTGDQHLFRGNPGEEVITESDPRHIRNGGATGNNFNIYVSGNVGANEEALASMVADAIDNITRTGRPVGIGF